MKIVVIGGSGLIGKKLVPILRERGHDAVPASPSSGVNALTGEGLSESLAGADVVVDVSDSPSWADDAVMEFFKTSRSSRAALRVSARQSVLVPPATGPTLATTRGYARGD